MKRRRKLVTGIGAALLVVLWWFCHSGAGLWGTDWSHAQVLNAIRYVESSWRDNVPDGDAGKAIGPYQIHRVYWLDAIAHRPDIGGKYADCHDRAYAERVIEAYMQLYVTRAWERVDAEVIARTHNGGPLGADRQSTLGYWHRVRAVLR
jgi:hypothetical protein